MSGLGQDRKWQSAGAMSAQPQEADIPLHSVDVGFVPKAVMTTPVGRTDRRRQCRRESAMAGGTRVVEAS